MARFVLSAFADEAGDSLEAQITALKENGIHYIEPRNIGGKGILTLTDDELDTVKAELDKNGIKVNSLGSPIGKFPIEKPLDEHLPDLMRAFEVCKKLGTTNIRMFSFFVEQNQLGQYRDEVIARLRKMVTLANENGIRLCHENESRIFGQNPAEVEDVINSVEGLYAIFDAANYRMNNCDIEHGINATLIRPAYLHIKDAIFNEQAIVPAGEGEGHIAEVLDKVNSEVDGVVYLTLEPHLFQFTAYKDIDDHELKGRHYFENNRQAFDFAVKALKELLIANGYREDENHEWIK